MNAGTSSQEKPVLIQTGSTSFSSTRGPGCNLGICSLRSHWPPKTSSGFRHHLSERIFARLEVRLADNMLQSRDRRINSDGLCPIRLSLTVLNLFCPTHTLCRPWFCQAEVWFCQLGHRFCYHVTGGYTCAHSVSALVLPVG